MLPRENSETVHEATMREAAVREAQGRAPFAVV